MTILLFEMALIAYWHDTIHFTLSDLAYALMGDLQLQLMILISKPVSALHVLLKRSVSFVRTFTLTTLIGLTAVTGLFTRSLLFGSRKPY